jgi:prepilin-type N-terminal cleavage/methylation domain-containing protein
MRRVRTAIRSLGAEDNGFTLVELLITIFVLGVIVAPLSAILIFHLRNSDATVARMNESHDAQLAASYFAQDVQAIGVRGDYTSTAEPSFVQSVETNVAVAGGMFPCGTAGTPDAVVRFAWDDFDDAAVASRTQKRIAYVVEGSELHRIECGGSAAVVTDVTIADDLVAPMPSVSCTNPAGVAMSCTGSTLPASVSVVLTIKDPDSGSDTPYEVTLTGHRRQT